MYNIFKQALTISILSAFLFVLQLFAFQEPSSSPPSGNVAAPLNTSNIGQTKAGGLILNTGGADVGLIIDKGKICIGSDCRSVWPGLSSVQTFTSSGTWTKPTGVTKVIIEVIGGGGGGSGGYAGCGQGGGDGGGGGGGGYAEGFIDVSAISSVPVTVGNGGGSGSPCIKGLNGGTSSFGAYVSASGGEGGYFQSWTGAGTGGVGSGGIFNSKGEDGKAGVVYGNGGYGGSSAVKGSAGGKGGKGGDCSATITAGETPSGIGGGGGGGGGCVNESGGNGKSGGNGAPGIIVVWEYK